MKKLYITTILIPLVIIQQGVFAASYNNGRATYTTRWPASAFIQSNNLQLWEDTQTYNETLPQIYENLNRSPKSFCEKYSVTPQNCDPQNNYKQQNAPSPSFGNENSSYTTPSWWREEQSYQGWGFD